MIRSITFDGYRGFRRYHVGGLSSVNLIVGRNNCGKTTVLEAVHLLASGGDPAVLARIAWQRGEVVFVPLESERSRRDPANPDISHFFHGHDFGLGAQFRLHAENQIAPLTVRITSLEELEVQPRLFDEITEFGPAYALVIEGAPHVRGHHGKPFPVSSDGALLLDAPYRYRRVTVEAGSPSPLIQFITPDSLEPRSMSDMWDRVLLEGREQSVIYAMRILEQDLSDIFFLSGERALRFGGRTGVLLGFQGAKKRLPMGSYGEGMRRLLALSLSLACTAEGVLLVDEIDTGLHWSIMGDMWRLVVAAAIESNVQVFATTHSLDCLRGIAWLSEHDPALADKVSVHKIDRHLDESVTFNAGQVYTAVEQEIELR